MSGKLRQSRPKFFIYLFLFIMFGVAIIWHITVRYVDIIIIIWNSTKFGSAVLLLSSLRIKPIPILKLTVPWRNVLCAESSLCAYPPPPHLCFVIFMFWRSCAFVMRSSKVWILLGNFYFICSYFSVEFFFFNENNYAFTYTFKHFGSMG